MVSIETAIEAIRRYCARNPRARDSLDGVDYWLRSENVHATRETLQAAVEHLVARGELAAFEPGDGSKVYGRP